jgi:dihydroneopterin triphosphate diphosphatase
MKIRKGNQIEAIVFRKNKNDYEFLLLKRIPEKGGFWQPVTGEIEENETTKEAVKREISEEIGTDKILQIIEDVYHFILEGTGKEEFVFGAEIDSNVKLTFDKNIYQEHEEHKWCSYDEAMQLLKWPGNKEGLKRLNEVVKNENTKYKKI